MKFKVGQVFKKLGKVYCVLDVINYNEKTYVLFSVETGRKFYFDIYEIQEEIDSYNLLKVKEQELFNSIMYIFEKKEQQNEGL